MLLLKGKLGFFLKPHDVLLVIFIIFFVILVHIINLEFRAFRQIILYSYISHYMDFNVSPYNKNFPYNGFLYIFLNGYITIRYVMCIKYLAIRGILLSIKFHVKANGCFLSLIYVIFIFRFFRTLVSCALL